MAGYSRTWSKNRGRVMTGGGFGCDMIFVFVSVFVCLGV